MSFGDSDIMDCRKFGLRVSEIDLIYRAYIGKQSGRTAASIDEEIFRDSSSIARVCSNDMYCKFAPAVAEAKAQRGDAERT